MLTPTRHWIIFSTTGPPPTGTQTDRQTDKMRFHVLTSLLALASTTSAAITWTLQKAANPTTDQADAYSKIEAAMRLAVARYARFSDASKRLTIQYEVSPGWPVPFMPPRGR